MSRSIVLALTLGVTGAIALQACVPAGPGREDVALVQLRTVACQKAQECDCEALLQDCDDERTNDPPEGLAFDDTCVEHWTAWLEEQSCRSPTTPSIAELCPLYHGTVYEGMPCETSVESLDALFASDCARGLYCINQVCRAPESVGFGIEHGPCELGRCEDGLFCREGLCERLPARGQQCPDHVCAPDLECDTVCVPLPGPGEPCLFGGCRSDSYCAFNNEGSFCTRSGSLGEICFGHRECSSGNCPAGRCEPPATQGDPCGSSLPCGPDHQCIDGSCEPIADGGSAGRTACQLIGTLLP